MTKESANRRSEDGLLVMLEAVGEAIWCLIEALDEQGVKIDRTALSRSLEKAARDDATSGQPAAIRRAAFLTTLAPMVVGRSPADHARRTVDAAEKTKVVVDAVKASARQGRD